LSGGPIKESGHRALASDYFAMPPGVKPLSEADKRAAVELHKAGLYLKRVREQLKMSERVGGLRRVLAYARKNPEALESMPNRLQEVIAREGNTTHY
jgi:hypothetical protein